jgi:hypothetical protein
MDEIDKIRSGFIFGCLFASVIWLITIVICLLWGGD